MRRLLVVAVAAFLGVAAASAQNRGSPDGSVPATCEVTPVDEELSLPFIAPAAGVHPLWLVDASWVWSGAEAAVNLYWVVARNRPGDLLVTGRRLDGAGEARFKAGVYETTQRQLFIADAREHHMFPSGASAEVLEQYSFRAGSGLFPAPGCWELLANLGDTKRRFVIWLGRDPQNP